MGRLSAKYKTNLMDIGVNSTYIIPLKRGRHPWLLTANIGIDVQNYNQGGFDTNHRNNGDQYFDGINEKAMKSKKRNATLISLPIAFDLTDKFVITREDNFFTSISLGYTPIFGKRKQETKVQLVNSNTDSSILNAGWYLVIDDIETHLNKDLIVLIMNLFTDVRANHKGASLIFSTPYLELLDEIVRKDNIYVTTTKEDGNLYIKKFSDYEGVTRNDILKSHILTFQLIEGSRVNSQNIERSIDLIIDRVK